MVEDEDHISMDIPVLRLKAIMLVLLSIHFYQEIRRQN